MAAEIDHLHDWRTGDDVPVLRTERIADHDGFVIAHLQGGEQTVVQIGTAWHTCLSDWSCKWTPEQVRNGLHKLWDGLPGFVDASDGSECVVKLDEDAGASSGDVYVTWADPAVGQAKVKAWMSGRVESLLPTVESMAATAQDELKQIAADLGEPYAENNKMFWVTLYDLIPATVQGVNSGSPELRTIVDLAKTVTPRQRNQWAAAKRITDEMFDEMDAGKTVGRGDVCLRLNPDSDPIHRATLLAECARFYAVPASYAPAVGDVVAALMERCPRRDDGSRWELPQHWANIYSYVVGAIAALAKPDDVIRD